MFIQFFFIFRVYVLDGFSNQFHRVIDVTKLLYFTQCSWMFEGNLKLALKLSKNTQEYPKAMEGALQ
jgi:hypothetical protein